MKRVNSYDLIYIYLNASYRSNSVQDKVVAQIKAMNDCGIKAHGLFFSADSSAEVVENINMPFEFIPVRPNINGWFRSLRENREMLKAMIDYLRNIHVGYKHIYIRNHRPSLLWYKFIREFSDRIVVEHQTIEEQELKNLSKSNQFGLKPSKLLSWLEFSFIPMWQEKVWGPLAIGQSKRLIGVTEEIMRYELTRARFGKPAGLCITNGIVVEDFKLRTAPPFDGKTLHLLMLVGGTTDVDWHGIDLIIEGIEKYGGPCKVYLHLAGHENNLKLYNSSCLIKYGFVSKEQIDDLCNRCHLALGTFAFERKGATEASTIKLREYAARSIPCVYGHFDSDYEILVNSGFALRLKSMSPPDINAVIKFAEIVNHQGISLEIRKLAITQMDMQVKMMQLKEIIIHT